jgi:asparagine synthase (glutamine-hydrolysing)
VCGICGAVQLGGEPRTLLAPDVLDRMTDAMEHRGPDDRGTYEAPGVALGVRRLSIVDVAGGHQPVASEDRTVWAVQNGELYNHEALRGELAAGGHRFRSRCDTEVIPHLYEQLGPGFPARLRGKFGLAVWDRQARRLVLARDRLGVKPLYVAQLDGLLLFASELKGLLASGLVETALDYEAIEAYLTLGYFPAPRTPLAQVRKLCPGELLVADQGGVRRERYWHYPLPLSEQPRRSQDEYAEELLAELEESVRLRLMSDVPLGAMLSGGLDSSLIVGLMARNMSEPVKTFSVGFAEDGDSNELADARLVARHFGTDHHELELSYLDDTTPLPELAWALDEPLADLSALGFLALSGLAAEHVTVALSGQGADELLAGYERHRTAALVGRWRHLPRSVRRPAENLASRSRSPRYARHASIVAAETPLARWIAVHRILDPEMRTELLGRGPLEGPERLEPLIAAHADGLTDDPLPAALYLDGQLSLVDDMLHYFDRASMARSLEVRVPFLDHKVVEYCARIPADLKIRRLRTKHLLKEAARGLVPDQIIDKRKIGFFNRALEGWMHAQVGGAISDYLLAPAPRYAEILDPAAVRRLVEAHASGRDRSHVQLLLAVLMLEVWLATTLPRAVGRPAPPRQAVALSA